MPLVGVVLGGVSVSDWKYVIQPASVDAARAEVAEVAVQYGLLIQTAIDFLPLALVIFLFLKAYKRMQAKAEEAPAAPPEDVLLRRETRHSLKRLLHPACL